ncbi:SDR family NAD(P)-dependent oxidoreductase [Streptomyces inhibens]|uniref:SDR family NAD(P)-dependent oxidoreductase n=1 Tax=Streptomyces inhibens TaxID=2293571 RepID=UPI00379B672B
MTGSSEGVGGAWGGGGGRGSGRVAVVTGGNKGLGLEAGRRLVEAGHEVYLGARDARRGEEAARLIGARPLLLDVSSEASVVEAAKRVREEAGRLDVLVNNAGVAGSGRPAREVTADELLAVYDTNVFGVVRVLHAFLPLLEEGAAPVVVNVSSGLGSLAVTADPAGHAAVVPTWRPVPAYSSSKAALNMLTAQYAHACPTVRINAVDPGHTATDLNGHTGPQTVEEGAEIIVRMALIGADGPSGGYFAVGGPVPW